MLIACVYIHAWHTRVAVRGIHAWLCIAYTCGYAWHIRVAMRGIHVWLCVAYTCGYAWHTRVAMCSIHTWISLAHDKLHEACKFHTTRKRGPCKHVTGFIIRSLSCVATCVHLCKSEVIIERYCTYTVTVTCVHTYVLNIQTSVYISCYQPENLLSEESRISYYQHAKAITKRDKHN